VKLFRLIIIIAMLLLMIQAMKEENRGTLNDLLKEEDLPKVQHEFSVYL
jgi:hypothetical protein